MHPLIMPAVLATTILFSMLAFYLVKKKRASAPSKISLTLEGIREGIRNDHYDVFLSFRGSDTRKGFTDHLYHSLVKVGIAPVFVFKDDKSIQIGEEFGPEILNAIARSKISILIISENYASSKWCLLELIHIMDRAKSPSHTVLPIFYKVDPSDVGDLKGNFGKKASHTCKKYKKYFNEENIQKVKKALEDVSHLQGWESQKVHDGHEGELVKKVIENVLSKLRQDYQLDVTKHLVGIDDHVNRIMKWVPSVVDTPSTTDVRMIGIYGMGGIGKTTLAKVIYNQLSNDFVHRSFLADIRETARCNNIAYLQKQLIKDILQIEPSNVDEAIGLIKSRFRGKKVLLLLDDIDHTDQLNAFARERNWFTAGSIIIVTTRYEAILDQSIFNVHKYDLNELDQEHALLLFNRHAFCMDHSSKEGLSRDIVSTMGGLPLALEVVGSYLYKKTDKVWEDVQKQLLKNQLHRDVQNILRISYDALQDEYKQIFLDIVCFFIGIYKDEKNAQFAMYMWEDCGFYPNQGIEELKLRCLIKIGDDGKIMVHDQLRDLGRSIFCQGQPLEKRSGPWDENYEGVPRVLKHSKGYPWFHDFLGAASSEDSKFSEVRWLQWVVHGNDASNLHLPKLSVLDLREYKSEEDWEGITENWEGWNSFMASKQLKVLSVQGCRNLRCTPELLAFTQLKILLLSFCGLERLHPSIGELTSLVTLDLHFCRGLKELPEEVGGLEDLEELLLDETGITAIPSSIGSLMKLKTLRAFMCKSLREIPSSIGDLQNLQHLDLGHTAIEKLPSAIGGLKNLQFLNLFWCSSLKGAIPSEIGYLPSLKDLNLSRTAISDLPESVGNLSSLQSLHLWECEELRSLPALPSSLQSLELRGCEELRSLPELPLGLTCLPVTCQSLGLPQLLRLIHLEILDLEVCHLLEDIRELSSITLKLCFEEWDKLTSLSLSGLTHLEELSIKKCSSIQTLRLSGFIHLKRLRIEHCDSLVEIEGCDNLESLEVIFLYFCECLKKFKASGCGNLIEIQGLDGVKSLEELDFTGCKSMETLPDLTGCEKLRSLRVRDCKKLAQLRGLEMLNLTYLDIFGCDSLEATLKLFSYECKRLKTFEASGCGNLVEIQGLDGAKFLEKLDLIGCKSMETLPDLMGCEKLRSLIVRDCKKLTQLRGLKMLNITYLDISGCDSLEAIPKLFLYECKHLKTFKVSRCDNLVEIQGLDGAKFLEKLYLTGCKSMETLPDLTGCEKLQSLIVRECKKLTQLQGLKMSNITYLDISGCDSLEAIPKLFYNECKHLKTFKASGCGNLVEIQGLDGVKFLGMLDLTGCKSMEALPDLIGFEKLQCLIVRDCKKLAQLRGLEMLNLIYLDISGCDSLEAIPNLSRMHVNGNYERHPWSRF